MIWTKIPNRVRLGCFKRENNAGCEMQLISDKSSLKGQEVKQVGDSSPIRIKASFRNPIKLVSLLCYLEFQIEGRNKYF